MFANFDCNVVTSPITNFTIEWYQAKKTIKTNNLSQNEQVGAIIGKRDPKVRFLTKLDFKESIFRNIEKTI